jgi:hypothetical protein
MIALIMSRTVMATIVVKNGTRKNVDGAESVVSADAGEWHMQSVKTSQRMKYLQGN